MTTPPKVAPGRLGPVEHQRAWEVLEGGQVDVLVVGGGVTGAGVALDAATRGLSVALVEARDFASGTSSRSSKLFHGGLRYLEQLEFPLVREALRERELMLTRLAPHLVEPVPFLFPLTSRWWQRAYVGAGLRLYDVLGGRSSLPRARHLTRAAAHAACRSLADGALEGAFVYHDARTDDARHVATLVRTAARHGAVVRSSTEVVGLVRAGQHGDGPVTGARLRDVDTGATTVVRARVVVGAAGVWSDEVAQRAQVAAPYRVQASKGVHLVVPRDRVDSDTGLILRTEKSVLFVIPWLDRWLVGTTDTPYDRDRAHPAVTRADVDYVLERVNAVLATPLTHDDVLGVFAGLRPLLAPGEGDQDTATLSREHTVARPVPGLVTVAGGKYTTYRVMARDAVDACRPDLEPALGPVRRSVTEDVPLLGAHGFAELLGQVPAVAGAYGLAEEQVHRLLRRYGALLPEVLAPAADDPSLLQPVGGAPDHLRAEVRYAVTHEGALHLDDVLTRRTRVSVTTGHRGVDSVEEVAVLVAPLLGWDTATTEAEVAAYRARVAAERAAQELEDEAAAEAARLVAPERRRVGSGL